MSLLTVNMTTILVYGGHLACPCSTTPLRSKDVSVVFDAISTASARAPAALIALPAVNLSRCVKALQFRLS